MDSVIFKEREIAVYAEPVSAADLKLRETYFCVSFDDEEMFVPTLEPLVFIGSAVEGGTEGFSYFQDFASYRAGHRIGSAEPDSIVVQGFQTASLGNIFDYEHALNLLLLTSIRRQKAAKA
jgi:hypothetical protein